jgi:hypothetical protein
MWPHVGTDSIRRRGVSAARLAPLDAGASPPRLGLGVEISCRVYEPRRPRESPLYRLVEQHLDERLRVWPTRFVRQHGPLRPVVERVLREFLKCGLLEHGYVVTQSVLSLLHAHAVASEDRAATPPPARSRARGAAHGPSRVGGAGARWILDEAAESVDRRRRRGRGDQRGRCRLQRGCDPDPVGDDRGPAASRGH